MGIKQGFLKFGMSKVRPEGQEGNSQMKIWYEERHWGRVFQTEGTHGQWLRSERNMIHYRSTKIFKMAEL